MALTPAWGPLHVPSAWSPVNPTPGIPYFSLHDISSPTPGERQGTPSVSLCHSLLSSHGAFFALLLHNLPCYTVISYLSLCHSAKSSLGATTTSHPRNRHAQYVFGLSWSSSNLEKTHLLTAAHLPSYTRFQTFTHREPPQSLLCVA